MSKKIAILLTLAIYCCLHLLADGHSLANREESVNGGRLYDFVWYNCWGRNERGENTTLASICLPSSAYLDGVLRECKEHWPTTVLVARTYRPC